MDYQTKVWKFFHNRNSLVIQSFDLAKSKNPKASSVLHLFEMSDTNHIVVKYYRGIGFKIQKEKWKCEMHSISEICEIVQKLLRKHVVDIFDFFPNELVCNQDYAIIYGKTFEKFDIKEIEIACNLMDAKYKIIDSLVDKFAHFKFTDATKSILKNCLLSTLENLIQCSKETIEKVVSTLCDQEYLKQEIKLVENPYIDPENWSLDNIFRNPMQTFVFDGYSIFEIQSMLQNKGIKTTQHYDTEIVKLFEQQLDLSPFHGKCFGCAGRFMRNARLNNKLLCFRCFMLLWVCYKLKFINIHLYEFSDHNSALRFTKRIQVSPFSEKEPENVIEE